MKIFISSTYRDLQKYRAALRELFLEMGHEPLMVEEDFSERFPSKKEHLKYLEEADILVGIYAHSYGHMRQDESISVLEQEYRQACKLGKEILCYMIDPAANWPEKFREDDFIKQERLEKFLAEIRQTRSAVLFKEAADIIEHIKPVVEKLSEIYDRLEKLQNWSKTLRSHKKLTVISGLALQNKQHRLSDEAFRLTTGLVATNFDTQKDSLAYRLADDLEGLLKGEIALDEYSRRANRLTRSGLKQFARSHLMAVLGTVAVLSMVLGLVIGYRPSQSGGEVDTAPLSPPAVSAESTGQGEAASGPDTSAVTEGEEIEAESPAPLSAEAAGIPPESPEQPGEQESTAAEGGGEETPEDSRPAGEREVASPVAVETPAETAPGSETVPPEEPPPTIDETQLAAMDYRQNDTLTIDQSLAAWKKFAESSESGSEASSYALQEVRRLQSIIDTTATIGSPDEFVICRNVDLSTRIPEGVADSFPPGRIWMWARVNNPRPGRVTARWYLNGNLYATNSAEIPLASPGYRIFFSRDFDSVRSGSGEVRFFNSAGILIARRTFKISRNAVTAR